MEAVSEGRPVRPCPDCAPQVADRGMVEPLCLEQPGGGGQMRVPVINAAAPGQCIQQGFVRPLVERGDLKPGVQMAENVVFRNKLDKALQYRGAAIMQTTPLGSQPGVEHRAALDPQAV